METTDMWRQYGDTTGDIPPRPACRGSGERNGTRTGDKDRRNDKDGRNGGTAGTGRDERTHDEMDG